jgi:ABC-type phosphate transport system substrate-binding protein
MTGCTEAQAEVSIAFNTTDASYYAMNQGKSELLLVYAPSQPTIDELDVFNTMDVREIGLDALVFIVNADNPIESLTSDQIRDIYSGKITNWSEVGGEDLEIVPFQRPELSGSQTLMLNLMMKETIMMRPTTEIVSETMGDIIDDISAYDNSANAIGYSVYYYAKNMYAQPGLKFIAVDGVMPSNETINNREYGFVNPFYGIIPLDPNPLAEAILDWLLTEEGQQLLVECGYVPIMQMD